MPPRDACPEPFAQALNPTIGDRRVVPSPQSESNRPKSHSNFGQVFPGMVLVPIDAKVAKLFSPY